MKSEKHLWISIGPWCIGATMSCRQRYARSLGLRPFYRVSALGRELGRLCDSFSKWCRELLRNRTRRTSVEPIPLADTEKEGRSKVVKVMVEARSGAARFVVTVRTQSIQRAVGLVGGRYPSRDTGVKFPIDPDGFFDKYPTARSGLASRFEQPERMAA